MSDDFEERPAQNNKAQLIDDTFVESRIKIEMILTLIAEKLQAKVNGLLETHDGIEKIGPFLEHLERVIFLNQMNRAKVRDLLHMAPPKYRKVISDAELMKELRPVRDEVNFPKRGPRGPREDVAEPAPDEA